MRLVFLKTSGVTPGQERPCCGKRGTGRSNGASLAARDPGRGREGWCGIVGAVEGLAFCLVDDPCWAADADSGDT